VPAEFVWASVGVGALLCVLGGALVFGSRRVAGWVSEVQRAAAPSQRGWMRVSPDEQVNARILRGLGVLFVAGGLLSLAMVAVAALSAGRAPAGAANREFQTVASQPTSGTSFEAAVATFMRNLRGPFGYTVLDATFTADREEPVCDVTRPACAPDPVSAPVRQWVGTLAWRERRDADRPVDRSCEVLAILTRGRGWQIEGSRWCDLLPR
jgi:hypothetical protein